MAVFEGGLKHCLEVAILMYEEGRATGLFNEDLAVESWSRLSKAFYYTKDVEDVEKAIKIDGGT